LRKEFLTLMILSSISGNVYASNAIPQQVYDNISVLEQEHYIDHKDVSTLSREELAYYVASILEKQPSNFDMLLSTRILEDETQLTLVKEQENSARKRLSKLLKDYKDTSELLYRKSIQGENRLEVMAPLKQKHDKLEAEYKKVGVEYEQAKARTHRLETMIESLKKRQGNNYKVDYALAELRAEFLPELDALKFFDEEAAKRQLYANTPVRNKIENKFKFDGQVMISHSNHSGEDVPEDQTKLKLSLYGDYNFDNNWHFLTSAEAEKSLSPSKDWDLELKNYYFEGKITKNIGVDIGKFNSKPAEGNVFDGAIKGVSLFGDNYRIERGSYQGMKLTNITLQKDNLSIGRYDFTNPNKTIYMVNGHLPYEKWDLGAMWLKGKNKNGYVLSLSNNINDWSKHSSAFWAKYYYQPSDTYVKHEMNGLADFMLPKDGFKGWSVGWRYIPKEDWCFGLEYYRLNNLLDNRSSNTIYAYLTYSFANYSED